MRNILASMLISSLALFAASASAADGDYLFDVIKKPSYRQAWNAMLANTGAPQWLIVFGRSGNGVTTPSTSLTIDGARYELGHVCKPHDCGDNQFQVMFTPGGGKAWGLLQENGKFRFFGDPSNAQREALRKAIDN